MNQWRIDGPENDIISHGGRPVLEELAFRLGLSPFRLGLSPFSFSNINLNIKLTND